jgi:hypothetical protein
MALVQGIYDLGKPGREQSLYTNRRDDAAMIQENFMVIDEFAESPVKHGLLQQNNIRYLAC